MTGPEDRKTERPDWITGLTKLNVYQAGIVALIIIVLVMFFAGLAVGWIVYGS